MSNKISIRFYNDREVRAIWEEEAHKWWFSVIDVVGALNDQEDYAKNRNYWKYLKNKLKKENPELVSTTNQLKITAPDGKKRLTDMLDFDGVVALAKSFPNAKANKFLASRRTDRPNQRPRNLHERHRLFILLRGKLK